MHVIANPLCKRDPLAVPSQADEVVGRVEMLNPFHFLFDDRAGIQVGGDVMARRADQFDAPLVGLFVGVRADECRQKAVMDVDDPTRESLAEIVGKNLHETGQHHQFDVLGDEDFMDFIKATPAAITIHIDLIERDFFALGDAATVAAISDDGGDLNGEFVKFRAPEDFVETVVGFGHQNRGFHAVGESSEMPVRLQGMPEGGEVGDELFHVDVEMLGLDFQASEKLASQLVGKLGELDQVPAMVGDVGGNLGNNPRLVEAAEFKNQSGT